MNILLISPKYDSCIIAPHLGLGYLSSNLKKYGHEVKILDGLREEIEYNPVNWDLVGITAMSTYFPEACQEVERAKSYGLKTIIGGPHIICDPEQSLIDSQADYAATGEGERTINQLASGLELNLVEGLVYWKDGKPKRSNPNMKKLFEQKKMYTTKIGNQSRDFQIDIDDFGELKFSNNRSIRPGFRCDNGTIFFVGCSVKIGSPRTRQSQQENSKSWFRCGKYFWKYQVFFI